MEEVSVDRPRVVSANISRTCVQVNITNIPQKSLIGLLQDNTVKMPSLMLDHMAQYRRIQRFLKMSGVTAAFGKWPLPSLKP